jgi:hypothetical protein
LFSWGEGPFKWKWTVCVCERCIAFSTEHRHTMVVLYDGSMGDYHHFIHICFIQVSWPLREAKKRPRSWG